VLSYVYSCYDLSDFAPLENENQADIKDLFRLIFTDFDMSDAQQEHALAVERLSPRLASLRIELCPGYMSEDCFWKIYFVLVHPRLSKHAADILSTPDVSEVLCRISSHHHFVSSVLHSFSSFVLSVRPFFAIVAC